MAGLSGGKYITFEKPYIGKVAALIESEKEILMTDRTRQTIIHSPTVKDWLRAVSQTNEAQIKTILKPSTNFVPLFNGYKWSEIEKSQFTGGGGSNAKTTAMQENATMFAIQKSIENNGYQDQKKFYQLYRDDLLKIYPDMNETWENAIFQQQLTTYREVGSTSYGHYSRDGGFMDYITETCKTLYKIPKKDTWNPADIWLVSDLERVKRELDAKIRDNTTSLQEFNAILRSMFKKRQVVGISLKLISGNNAKWELVNLDSQDVFDGDQYSFQFQKADLTFALQGDQFRKTDSLVFIGSSKQEIKFQIRQNEQGKANLKLEATDLSAQSARLGKVPLDMASSLFRNVGLESQRWRSWKNYPTNTQEFLDDVETHVDRFKKLQSTRNVDLGVRNDAEFVKNMTRVFEKGRSDVALSKLMQLDILNEMFSIRNRTQLNNALTDLGFLAQKKGDLFGPFAKLY
tara:strand:- start:1539 stop:2918 length:1380 start_codon:yes stop_codon:yes gene_type:complete